MKKSILFFTIISLNCMIFTGPKRNKVARTPSPEPPLSALVLQEFHQDPEQTQHFPSPASSLRGSPETDWQEVTKTPLQNSIEQTLVAPQIADLDDQDPESDNGFFNFITSLCQGASDLWQKNIQDPMLFQNLLKKMTITGRATHAYILLGTIQSGKFSDFIALLETQSVGRSTRAVEKALIETMESKTEKDFLMLVAAAKDDGILTKISVDIKERVHELVKKLQKNNSAAQTQQLEKFIHRSYLLTVLKDATSSAPKNIKILPCHAINKRAERTTTALTRFIEQRSQSAPPPDKTSSEEE